MPHTKRLLLVLVGNTLEYYDFLLFAHLGFIITPHFFPDLSLGHAHLLSLFLFATSFVIRPIGAYIFGRISDKYGRRIALIRSMKWAIFPAIGLCFLPSYEMLGMAATYLFVMFRLLQGIALGGEYLTASTYLMEFYKEKRGLVSGILASSGTIGSLLGFSLAYICAQPGTPDWLWRIGFLFGAVGRIISYKLRKLLLVHEEPSHETISQISTGTSKRHHVLLVVAIGMMVSLTNWIPATYSNFYLTKVLNLPINTGLFATCVALLGYFTLLPIFGWVSDKFKNHLSFLKLSCIAMIPLAFLGFICIMHAKIVIGQLLLVIVSASIGSAFHVVINQLFPKEIRGRYVSTCFMIGASMGAIIPSLSGYITEKLDFHLSPPCAVTLGAFILFTLLKRVR